LPAAAKGRRLQAAADTDGFSVPLPADQLKPAGLEASGSPRRTLSAEELVSGAPSLPKDLPLAARAARFLSASDGAPAPAPAPAEDGGEGDGRTDAQAAADCSSMGWVVERLKPTTAKPLLPADLAQAQLAARRLRQAGRR
jgi:hypothetical protein